MKWNEIDVVFRQAISFKQPFFIVLINFLFQHFVNISEIFRITWCIMVFWEYMYGQKTVNFVRFLFMLIGRQNGDFSGKKVWLRFEWNKTLNEDRLKFYWNFELYRPVNTNDDCPIHIIQPQVYPQLKWSCNLNLYIYHNWQCLWVDLTLKLFHWNSTDPQGFRYISRTRPVLSWWHLKGKFPFYLLPWVKFYF